MVLEWLLINSARIDWGKDNIEFKHKERYIKLQVQDETTNVKLCKRIINLEKVKRKGSEVLLAYIFSMLKEGEVISNVHSSL
jgi:hypothetical protein